MTPHDLAQFTQTVAVMVAAEPAPIFERLCLERWEAEVSR